MEAMNSYSFEMEIDCPIISFELAQRTIDMIVCDNNNALLIDKDKEKSELLLDVSYSSANILKNSTNSSELFNNKSIFTGNPAIKYPVRFNSTRKRKTFKCWFCPSVQHSFDRYLQHKNKHFTKLGFDCTKCSYSCQSKGLLARHNLISHNIPQYTVSYNKGRLGGGVGFDTTATGGVMSVEVSNVVNQQQFNNGDKCTTDAGSIPRDLLLKMNDKKEDGASFNSSTTSSGTRTSFKDQTGRVVVRCRDSNCPAIFRSILDEDEHYQKRHKIANRLNKFHCKLCTYKNTQENLIKCHLQNHINTNGTEYEVAPCEFKCAAVNCPDQFYLEVYLQSHMTQHNGVKRKYQCKICTYGANNIDIFKKHKNNHIAIDGQYPENILPQRVVVSKKMKVKAPKVIKQKQPRPTRVKLVGKKLWTNRNAVRDGLISQDELCQIRKGNPKFEQQYKSERYTATGKRLKCSFRCLHCSESFTAVHYWCLHQRKHGILKYTQPHFKCDICNYNTYVPRNFRQHMAKHSNSAGISTNFSPNKLKVGPLPPTPTTDTKEGIKILGSNDNIERWIAQTGRASKSGVYIPEWIRVHRGRVHKGKQTELKSGLVNKKEWCQIRKGNPSFSYNSRRVTKSGKNINTPFRCPFCPLSFPGYQNWQKHQSTHSHAQDQAEEQEYEYTCTDCNYTTLEESVFKEHCKLHKVDLANHKETSSDESDDQEFEESERNPESLSGGLYISELRMQNFMSYKNHKIKPRLPFYAIQRKNSQMSTYVVGCLLALGYDLSLELADGSTLCGINLNDVLRRGKTEGFVEVTLLVNSNELVQKFGTEISIRRKIKEGIKISSSGFEVAMPQKSQGFLPFSINGIKKLVNKLIPTFLLRTMLLGPENVHFFATRFHKCEELFWSVLAEKQKPYNLERKRLDKKIGLLQSELLMLKNKLAEFASYLEEKRAREGEEVHTNEIIKSGVNDIENYKNYSQLCIEALKERKLNDRASMEASPEFIISKMTKVFHRYLNYHDLEGDISLEIKDGGKRKSWVVWVQEIKDNDKFRIAETTIEEGRRIWANLSLQMKEIAIIGVIISFWEIMDSNLIIFADAYTTSQHGFKLSEGGYSVLMNFVYKSQKYGSHQIMCSLPDDYVFLKPRQIEENLIELNKDTEYE